VNAVSISSMFLFIQSSPPEVLRQSFIQALTGRLSSVQVWSGKIRCDIKDRLRSQNATKRPLLKRRGSRAPSFSCVPPHSVPGQEASRRNLLLQGDPLFQNLIALHVLHGQFDKPLELLHIGSALLRPRGLQLLVPRVIWN
jgi:hypothetical protein